MKIITSAQAAEIINDEYAENMPYRVLNQAGKSVVATWVKRNAKADQNIDAWYSDAEQSANNAAIGESVIIEMSGIDTFSGRPETLAIPDESFDWSVNS